jgi:hypothetical protein
MVINDNLHHYELYKLVVDETNPPPPVHLLRLAEIRVEDLQSIALESGLKGWSELGKANLVRFLETHRYIFPDVFYEQRSFPDMLKAWTELFAPTGVAKHYTEVIRETLVKASTLWRASQFFGPTHNFRGLCFPRSDCKRDSYLRGVRDPFSKTFDSVSESEG